MTICKISMRFSLLLPCLTGICLLHSPVMKAQTTLTAIEQSQAAAICSGQTPQLPVLTGRKKLLITDTDGSVHTANQLLAKNIRASSMAATGAIACLAIKETTLENCNFGPLFGSIPRVRRDYQLSVFSVEPLVTTPLVTLIEGSLPASCNNAGTIDSSVTAIKGSLPEEAGILSALSSLSLDNQDPDGDGYSNLEEFVQGSDMEDAASPGMEISVTANNSSDLVIPEGEAITLSISLNPADHLREQADYYLYSDSLAGMFAYFYPKRFEPVTSRTKAVSGPALRFNDINIITLPAMGVGEYQVTFEVEIDGLAPLRSQASITVISSDWQFTEVSSAAGINYSHGYAIPNSGSSHDRRTNSGGVAAGDFDGDGWTDLYVIRGTIGPNLLYRNTGNGRFEEVGAQAGVDLTGQDNAAATFADYDGDGWLDLIVTGINGTQVTLFRNRGDGTFQDVTGSSGITDMPISYGATFADYDKDGDLDLWINHWLFTTNQGYLWQNNGDGTFRDVSAEAGIPDGTMADFTTNFADINNDDWLDLLVSADYESSQVFLNNQDGTFKLVTTPVISDENGMGGAVGDYDNDGDLDWFVSSVYDYRTFEEYPWGITGNRFYKNDGQGNFSDVTDETGTRIGHWGWGSCFADFNNDAWLDLFHVNGFSGGGDASVAPFVQDPAQLFISDQQGSFLERGIELGMNDIGQGRGIVCFDYDRDGDIDVFIANNRQPPALYRNDGGNNQNYLHIQLQGEDANSEAVGARIYVTINGLTQMRELRNGSNFLSQNPVEAYFGLGTARKVDLVRVVWPSGVEKTLEAIDANQLLTITHP
jgi:hypothetical protein